jgi:hypothetical protein
MNKKNKNLLILLILPLFFIGLFIFYNQQKEINVYASYTGDICTGGTASSDNEYGPSYAASYAFDDLYAGNANYWQTGNVVFPHWLKYDFGSGNAKKVVRYTLRSFDNVTRIYDINNWTFQGSNDNTNWTTLDTRSSITWTQAELKLFDFTNDTAYRYYRIYITSNSGGNNYALIQEMEMMELETDCVSSTGIACTQTTDGLYTINTYTLTLTTTASTTWTPPTGVSEVEYLVVAGGGAGGGGNYHGGGGGAGGFRTATGYVVNDIDTYTVTVGAGGVGTINTAGANGSNSIFDTITSIGGGGGGMYNGVAAKNGGSGGGGGYASTAGSGTPGQGNAGGLGTTSANYGNGGGGGAGAAGGLGNTTIAGSGGAGLSSSITGTATYYAGGGGGAIYSSGTPGAGGIGGGGAGSMGDGTSGTANTGGGGGGAERNGTAIAGSGGSGIVVIRYLTPVSGGAGGSFTVKKEDGCACTLASECYSDVCNSSNVCGEEMYTSTNLTCYITNGTCDGTTVLKLYDQSGGHAELASQLNYVNKVCCTGTGISNACSGYHDVVLSLYSETNSHVEKDTESNYINDVCLHSDTIPVVCDYSTDCSLLGAEYVCLASISGDTNAHIGKCSTYTNKVCCMIGVTVDDCESKVASDKSIALKDIDIQFCSGADVTNSSDPCYDVCWKGTGAPDLTSADWKCGVCHDSSNNTVSCSTLVGTTYSWVMPAGYVEATDYTLVGASTLTSANPIINFTNADDTRIVTLNMSSMGTSCSGQNLPRAIPDWKEISPF